MATYEQIVEANRATFAAWNAHDPDAVAAIFAAEAVIRGLVVEDVNFWDVGALLAQLGAAA